MVQLVLSCIWRHWHSPVDGVPEQIRALFGTLLESYKAENCLLNSNDDEVGAPVYMYAPVTVALDSIFLSKIGDPTYALITVIPSFISIYCRVRINVAVWF